MVRNTITRIARYVGSNLTLVKSPPTTSVCLTALVFSFRIKLNGDGCQPIKIVLTAVVKNLLEGNWIQR